MENVAAGNAWVFVVVSLVLVKVIELLVQTAYKNLSGDRYVSKKDCENCKNVEVGSLNTLEDDLKLMRGILLVVAVKVGVPESEWRKLAE